MRISRDRAARRRLAALTAAALAATGVGALVGSNVGEPPGQSGSGPGENDGRVTAEAVGQLSLGQQVGQVLVLSFPGRSAPTYVRRILRDGEAAGVVLFGANVGSPRQVRELTSQLREASAGSALVATDQEGGETRILDFAAPEQGQASQSTPAAARAAALQAARDLRAVGVNVNLAPVADVPSGRSVVRDRAFPGPPARVVSLVRGALGGYREGGVAATAKHFPGFGAAAVNTDDAPASIARRREQIEAVDLEPFRVAVRERVPLVMASHALYPAYDAERIASQSRELLVGVLRERLGFGGVVVTDSLEAEAVLGRSSIAVAAERSLEAGADLVLMTGSGSFKLVYPHLLRRARSSGAFRARVREAAGRVLALKRRLGLRGPRVER